jgi:hypothetical protein
MRRSIHQAIARHYTVDAAAPDPVVRLPVLFLEINEFDACPGRQQVAVRGFAPVASVVEPVGLDVGGELLFDLTGSRVPAGKYARTFAGGDVTGPDQAVDDEKVLGAVMA